MISVTHLNADGQKQFDTDRLNSVFVFAIQRLDHAIECNLPMSGSNHKFTWDFVKTNDGFDITIQDK
jgi:hypothetical protein